MAEYKDLVDLDTNSDFRDKVKIAVTIKAEGLLTKVTPSTDEVTWAAKSLVSPVETADNIVRFVIAANNTATTAQILGASDAAIQANVDTAADALIAGGAV